MESLLLKDVLGMYFVQRQAVQGVLFVSYRHNFLVHIALLHALFFNVTTSYLLS